MADRVSLAILRAFYARELDDFRGCASCWWYIDGEANCPNYTLRLIAGNREDCHQWRSCRDALARVERERMGR